VCPFHDSVTAPAADGTPSAAQHRPAIRTRCARRDKATAALYPRDPRRTYSISSRSFALTTTWLPPGSSTSWKNE